MRFLGKLTGGAIAAVLVLGLAPGVSAQTEGIRLVEAELALPEGVSLPSDAFIVVEARNGRGQVMGEAAFRPRGRQAPFPVTLGIPASLPVTLHAAAYVDGTARLVADGIPVPEVTGDVSLGPVDFVPFADVWTAGAYRCGDVRLSARFFPEAAAVTIAGYRMILDRARSGSGARYEVAGDPGTWIWSRGNGALLSVGGVEYPECSVVPPEAPADYVARGNEPGWTLTLSSERADLITNYGQDRIEVARPAADFSEGAVTLALPGSGSIRIAPALCRDTMTGMPYPDSVEIALADGVISGCGGAAVDTLTGPEWIVSQIDGDAPVAGTLPTLRVGRDGTVTGQAGCNRYATELDFGGEGVSTGPIAATRMACLRPIMDQEQAFFAALAAVDRFDFDDTGVLVIFDDKTGTEVLRARR